MKKLHVHVKVKDHANVLLALECAKFLDDTARAWSADLHQLATVFVFHSPELGDELDAEVIADLPGLPSTSKGLSIVGQQWFDDQLYLRKQAAAARVERARKAAAARWGGEE